LYKCENPADTGICLTPIADFYFVRLLASCLTHCEL
jgi:hypothetical protein